MHKAEVTQPLCDEQGSELGRWAPDATLLTAVVLIDSRGGPGVLHTVLGAQWGFSNGGYRLCHRPR